MLSEEVEHLLSGRRLLVTSNGNEMEIVAKSERRASQASTWLLFSLQHNWKQPGTTCLASRPWFQDTQSSAVLRLRVGTSLAVLRDRYIKFLKVG